MLSVRYALTDLPPDAPVQIREARGTVHYDLSRGLFLPEGVAALNSATTLLLEGGQWFQLWKGEIVSMYSPSARRDDGDGRIHRGPLVDQAAGPQDR